MAVSPGEIEHMSSCAHLYFLFKQVEALDMTQHIFKR